MILGLEARDSFGQRAGGSCELAWFSGRKKISEFLDQNSFVADKESPSLEETWKEVGRLMYAPLETNYTSNTTDASI